MPTLDLVRAAAARIAPYVHRTPCLSATSLGDLAGVSLTVKAELFQKTGSFKVRGCFNAVLSMPPERRSAGLVTMSAGNHAAGLAYAARALGTTAVVVMPAHANPGKIAAVEAYGGEVVLTDGALVDTLHRVQEETGRTLVHPFDDPAIIAGNGTVGLEIAEDVGAFDTLVVQIGGGGLASGCAAVLKALRPGVTVVGVEPEGADAMTRALAAGEPVPMVPSSVADGLCAPFAGTHTLAAVRSFVDRVVTVPDEAIVEAMRRTIERTKLAVEPAAAAGVAALLTGAAGVERGSSVVVVATGGNMDGATYARLLA
ncbi:MAG TPA: threonine/serine dehydratase [Mycobacteriales bacterium]|jgi:threonine dehydratase